MRPNHHVVTQAKWAISVGPLGFINADPPSQFGLNLKPHREQD